MDKEILEAFREETNQILSELADVVESLEETGDGRSPKFPSDRLTEFAQKIDRVMGAAKTLGIEEPNHVGLKRIGQIAEICKTLGYKASEIKKAEILPLFAAFWADTLDVLAELMSALENETESEAIAGRFSLVLQKRLKWLAEKLNAIEKTTNSTNQTSQLDVDALLKGFGI